MSFGYIIIIIIIIILVITFMQAIIIIIIIIILVIIFMQSIHNYIPKTNLVTTVYSVAAVLYLQFVLHVMLLLLLLSSSSSLCRLFTIIYLKQAMSLRYTVLQLFCIYSLCYM